MRPLGSRRVACVTSNCDAFSSIVFTGRRTRIATDSSPWNVNRVRSGRNSIVYFSGRTVFGRRWSVSFDIMDGLDSKAG